MVGVVVCKAVGLSGPAILIGAVIGVIVAFAFSRVHASLKARKGRAA